MMDGTARAETEPNRFVVIGEIVKGIGLKGELKLYPLLDFRVELLDSDYLIWADGEPAGLVRHRPSGQCVAVKVRGVDNRNQADSSVGRKLGFMSANYLAVDFPRTAGGLPFRWLGREVVTDGGENLGTVTEVRLAGAGYVIVLPDPLDAAREIMIPALPPILRAENALSGALVVDLPEGLLDVQRG